MGPARFWGRLRNGCAVLVAQSLVVLGLIVLGLIVQWSVALWSVAAGQGVKERSVPRQPICRSSSNAFVPGPRIRSQLD